MQPVFWLLCWGGVLWALMGERQGALFGDAYSEFALARTERPARAHTCPVFWLPWLLVLVAYVEMRFVLYP